MYNHPYAPLLLMLTHLARDEDMIEVMDSNSDERAYVEGLIEYLEEICDCSFREF